MQKRSSSLAQG